MPKSIQRPFGSVMLALALAAPFGLGTMPGEGTALGQSLGNRIDAVRQKHAERAAQKREPAPEIKILQKLLYTEITLAFHETPARDVIDYFRTALGVNLVGRYLDDRTAFGIDPELPITLEIEKIRAIDALDLVLEECSMPGDECTWQIRKGVLEVGTKERLGERAAQVVRVYPIDDLLYQPESYGAPFGLDLRQYYDYGPGGYDGYSDRYLPGRYAPHRYYGGGGGGPSSGSFGGPRVARDSAPNSAENKNERAEELIEMIVSTIEPAAWARNGGEWASIEHREGALVVRAPDFIQREIGGYGRVPKPRTATRPGEDAPAPASPEVPVPPAP